MNKDLPFLIFLYLLTMGMVSRYHPQSLQESLVVERDSIASVYEFLDPRKDAHCGTLIIFDIDNTLIQPEECDNPEQLASDQWYYAFADYLMKKYDVTFDQATEVINPINKKLLKRIAFEPIEPHTSCLVHNLQLEGYTVVALTARNCGIIDQTIKQLHESDIDFTRTKKCPHDFSLQVNYPACFKAGVIFSESNDKGEVLEQWLKTINRPYRKIIFIDDKEKNVLNIKREADKLGIPFVGIRYNYLDKKIKAYRFIPPIEKEIEPFLQRMNYVH